MNIKHNDTYEIKLFYCNSKAFDKDFTEEF